MDEESEYFSNSKSSASGCCICQFQPGVAHKIVAYKKQACNSIDLTYESSCYILTCLVKLLLEKAVKQNVTHKTLFFLS